MRINPIETAVSKPYLPVIGPGEHGSTGDIVLWR
jgi:hypothetical protein